MSNPFGDPQRRVMMYATQQNIVLKQSLGFGKDGLVYATESATAVKVYYSHVPFRNELACYLRLRELQVREVLGHSIPTLLAWDEELLVLEMKVVQPPYILDFASARLDIPPDFPDDVLAQWELDRQDEFGPRWPHVQFIIHIFEQNFGIYLLDIHPRNITFSPNQQP
jgi:hypothetical protein